MMEIRPLAPGDRPEWKRLYRGHADFYRVVTSAEKLATFFNWQMDPAHPCNGLAGFTHCRAMPSPLRGAEVGFLHGLFVDPYRRGDGAGEALPRRVDEIAATRGWGLIRWITRNNNYRARGLYDRLSPRSDGITYEMTATTTGREVK